MMGPLLPIAVGVAEDHHQPTNAIIAASHHQLKSYRWNSWWVFFLSCIHLVKARCEFQTFQDSKSFAKRWARHIYTFILETVSDWYIWHLRWSNILAKNVVVIQHDTWGHLSTRNEAILLKKPGIWRLEKLEKLEVIPATSIWLQVEGAPATFKRSPAVPMYTWAGEWHDQGLWHSG